ncbi:MAG TPA: trigger factor [Pyrinomonadaceae bacterium]|nr:trigger factor [Pyrinomonadaceae bacterium]
MKTELIDVSPTRKEIKIEIDPEQVKSEFDRISQQYSKAANVPGFRPGHAPTSVVRTRYKSEIRSEVLRELLPNAVNNAIVEHKLVVLGEPDVQFDNTEALERLGEEPLTLKVTVEILPDIKLDTYKGIEATRIKRPISDDDVNKMIESLREASASLQPVEDRASQLGDTVTINATGKMVDEPESEEIKVDDVEVVLGAPGVIEQFTENLTGVKPEDTRTFTVDYPADYNSKGLAGKKVEYTAEVTAVRQKELPEFDDEWAKSLGGDFDSAETLKAKVREDLEARATAESDRHLRDQLIRKLIDSNQFEVPQSLIEQQTGHRLQDVARQMMSRGMDPNNQELNWEAATEEMRVQAEGDVRATMLLEKIAEAENITVSNEEVEAEIQAIASAARQPLEQVRAALTKDGGERSIAHRLRNRKALEFLVENAQVTDGEWTEPKGAEEQAPEEETQS